VTSITLKLFLTMAFIIFAWSNLGAIIALGRLRTVLLERLPADMKAIRESMVPATSWQYFCFHLVLDLLVVGSIWLVPWQSIDLSSSVK
jgi:hypothetical protein